MAYNLEFSKEKLDLSNSSSFLATNIIRNKTYMFAVKGNELIAYQYNDGKWNEVIRIVGKGELIYVGDLFQNGWIIVVRKNVKSITFSCFENNEIRYLDNLVISEENYEKILLGNIFNDKRHPGIFIQYSTKIEIYKISEKYLFSSGMAESFALMDSSKYHYLLKFLKDDSEFTLGNLRNDDNVRIIARNKDGTYITKYDDNYGFKNEIFTPHCAKQPDDGYEKLHFAKLSNQKFEDLVFINSSGLFVHQFDEKTFNYKFEYYSPMFSKKLGWNEESLDTIQFENVCMTKHDEMIFTGPQGIAVLTYDYISKKWISLLDNSNLSIQERYSNIIKVIPTPDAFAKNQVILLEDNNEIHSVKLVQSKKFFESNEPEEDKAELTFIPLVEIPEIKTDMRKSQHEKIAIHLSDQLTNPSLFNSIDKTTGRPKFTLPLFEIPNPLMSVRVGLLYDGASKISSIMGLGWSLPQNNYIMVDRRSVFPEDHKYFLVFQNVVEELIYDPKNLYEDASVMSFKLNESHGNDKLKRISPLTILYFKRHGVWTITSGSITQEYGCVRSLSNKCETVSTELARPNWYEEGTTLTEGQSKIPFVWHLSSIHDTNKDGIYFKYKSEIVQIPESTRYVTETYLTEIIDTSGNIIKFSYEEKDTFENFLLPSSDPKFVLISNSVQKRYLGKININTPSRYQVLHFDYTKTGKYRLLTSISDEHEKPVMEFDYYNNYPEFLLKHATYPTGAVISFDYSKQGHIESLDQVQPVVHNVESNYKIIYGNDFVIVSSVKDKKYIILDIFNSDMMQSRNLLSFEAKIFFDEYSKEPKKHEIQNHEIIEIGESVAVIVFTLRSTLLYLLRRDNGKWQNVPEKYFFSNNTVIKFGLDLIAIHDVGNPPEMIYWDNKWKREKILLDGQITQLKNILIDTDRNRIAIYDDHNLWIVYKDKTNKWKNQKITEISGQFKQMKKTLSRFGEENTGKDWFIKAMKSNYLQLKKNLVLLSTIKASPHDDLRLITTVHVLALNENYDLAYTKKIDFIKDYVSDLRPKFSTDDAKTNITLKYELKDDKYDVFVSDYTGYRREQINAISNRNLRKDKENSFFKSVTEDARRNLFPLSIQKYNVILYEQTITSGNIKYILNDNYSWKASYVSDSLFHLGKSYVLDKQNDSFKICVLEQEGKREIFDLGVQSYSQIQNRFPYYIAYQKQGELVKVIEFENEWKIKDKITTLPPNEKLSYMSGFNVLVTEKDGKLIFRTKMNIRHSFPNSVAVTVSATFKEKGSNNEVSRSIGYEYDSSTAELINNSVRYNKITTIPANNKSLYGYIEESVDSLEKKVFDKDGALIKIFNIKDMLSSMDDSNSEDVVNMNSTLFDKTGFLEVAKFIPSELVAEEAAYYGFEDYEKYKIGGSDSKTIWKFNKTGIRKNQFSFTGKNYLHIENDIMEGVFEPKQQDQIFVASCWMRPEKNNPDKMKLGETRSYLKAIVYHDDINSNPFVVLSEVKMQYEDWFYLETIIDLPYIQQIYMSRSTEINNPEFKIAVTVGPEAYYSIDVDHIRFSPLNAVFEAYVYNYELKKISDIIGNNGLVQKFIYDQYGNQIANTNEYGQIEIFNTFTKAHSYSGDSRKYRSQIQIKPEHGIYENFSPYAFNQRVSVKNVEVWNISPYQLHHNSKSTDQLKLSMELINNSSFAISFNYYLKCKDGAIVLPNILEIKQDEILEHKKHIKKEIFPQTGEILIVRENNHVYTWINGELISEIKSEIESFSENKFILSISGNVTIKDLIIFNNPTVKITHINPFGEETQELILENEDSVIIVEYLYDELGRKAITTKPIRIKKKKGDKLLGYHSNFITNRYLSANNSVWNIGELHSDIVEYDGFKFDFTQTRFYDNVLNQIREISLPGHEYSRHYAVRTKSCHLEVLYSPLQNYTFRSEHRLDGVEETVVFNINKNKVASCIHIPEDKNLLTTYSYNEDNKLVSKLPPMYHEAVTFNRLQNNASVININDEEMKYMLGTYIKYDKSGNLISKKTQDTGKFEYIYDKIGLLRFIIFYPIIDIEKSSDPEPENVLYLKYDSRGRLRSTGKFTQIPNKQALNTYLEDMKQNYTNTEEYQQFYYSDYVTEPSLRGRTKRVITFNNGEPLIEEFILNADQETLSKRYITTVNVNSKKTDITNKMPLSVSINKSFVRGKVESIEYPIEIDGKPLVITYKYNKIGKIETIGVPKDSNLFARYQYDNHGQLEIELFQPESINQIICSYSYDSSGYYTLINCDGFLSETIDYDDKNSYGGYKYGDGTVTRTLFKAEWHEKAKQNKISLNPKSFITKDINEEISKLCYESLKSLKYINYFDRQQNILYLDAEPNLPMKCSEGNRGYQISKMLGMFGFPSVYGHKYDYGYSKELVKAKYFVGTDDIKPLQPLTFTKILESEGIDKNSANEIWKLLTSNEYIYEEKERQNSSHSHGVIKSDTEFVEIPSIKHLELLNPNYGVFYNPIKKMIYSYCKANNVLSSSGFLSLFKKWVSPNFKHEDEIANNLWMLLHKEKFTDCKLAKNFKKLLSKYKNYTSTIAKLLIEYAEKQPGRAEYDVEYKEIDANGNQKIYITGSDKYELKYRKNTNQIQSIIFASKCNSNITSNYQIDHDNMGNVIKAEHKNIAKIIYDKVSNRPTEIQMQNGIKIMFYYDSQGERVLKRVKNQQGKITKEIHYIRDDKGRCYVERQITYLSDDKKMKDVQITAYIYGPRGMIGYLRRGEYYSIVKDHEGSTRLVVKNGEVVAAYDYLPYGSLMREFTSYSEGNISYRYIGQEYDEETGLYNYHARLYDPTIGRFYQTDPLEQYASPYKYAGNSPVSVVDFDGQFAFTLGLLIAMGIGAILGGYIGGSAENNRWNPVEWDFSDKNTWIGMFMGSGTGALIPLGFVSVEGTTISLLSYGEIANRIALGAGASYLSAAADSKDWNPSHWNFESPATWNALGSGFQFGSSVLNAFSGAKSFYFELSAKGKNLFKLTSAASFGVTFTLGGYAENWDFTRPQMWSNLASSITSAWDIPYLFKGGSKFLQRLRDGKFLTKLKQANNVGKMLSVVKNSVFNRQTLRYLVKSLFITGLFTLSGFKTDWDFSSVNTYSNLISGFVTGAALYGVYKASLGKYHGFFSDFIPEEISNIFRRKLLTEKTIELMEFERGADNSDSEQYIYSFKVNVEDLGVTATYKSSAETFTTTFQKTVTGESITAFGSLSSISTPMFSPKDMNNIFDLFGSMPDSHKSIALNSRSRSIALRTIEEIVENTKKEYLKENNLRRVLSDSDVSISYSRQVSEEIDNIIKTNGNMDRTTLTNTVNEVIERETEQNSMVAEMEQNINMAKASGAEEIDITRMEFDKAVLKRNFDAEIKVTAGKIDRTVWQYVKRGRQMVSVWNRAQSHVVLHMLQNFESALDILSNSHIRNILPVIKYNIYQELRFPLFDNLRSFLRINPSFMDQVSTDPVWTSRIQNLLITDGHEAPILEEISENQNYIVSITNAKTETTRLRRSLSENGSKTKVQEKFLFDSVMQDLKLKLKSVNNSIKRFGNNYDEVPTQNQTPLTQVDSAIDVNGTLMLIDMLVKKITGEKFISPHIDFISLTDAQAYALNISENFENILEILSTKYNLYNFDFNYDPIELMKKVVHNLLNGKNSKIPQILYETARNALPVSIQNDEFSRTLENILRKKLVKKRNKFIPNQENRKDLTKY